MCSFVGSHRVFGVGGRSDIQLKLCAHLILSSICVHYFMHAINRATHTEKRTIRFGTVSSSTLTISLNVVFYFYLSLLCSSIWPIVCICIRLFVCSLNSLLYTAYLVVCLLFLPEKCKLLPTGSIHLSFKTTRYQRIHFK